MALVLDMLRFPTSRRGLAPPLVALVIASLVALVPAAAHAEPGGEESGVRPVDELDFGPSLILPPVAEPAVPVIGSVLRDLRPFEVTESPLTTAPVCDDGTSGPRVQLLYVRTPSQPDTYSANVETFREAITFGDGLLDDSVPGRAAHLRLVHSGSPNCVIDVKKVVVPESTLTGGSALSKTIRHLQTVPGLQDPNRKYLFFSEVDLAAECGLAAHWVDESPGGGNLNNGILPTHGGVGKRCWNVPYDNTNPNAVAAIHEVVHMLGAVSSAAPHASAAGHCTDENDLMCYADGVPMTYGNGCGPDPGAGVNNDPNNYLLDCNDDDYFDPTRPTAGFLAARWNTADSDFISGDQGDRFIALPKPLRAYDSRDVPGRVGSGGVVIPLSISPGNPASRRSATIPWDATGVMLNVTAVDPTQDLYAVVWPAGLAQPLASNLNLSRSSVAANQVTVKLGNGGAPYGSGAISVAAYCCAVDIIVDVVGYYRRSRPAEGDEFEPVTPYRMLSSRDGIGAYSTKWGPGQVRRVNVADGSGAVPTGASAVVLNLTTTQSTAPRSHLRVYPAGSGLSETSSINFLADTNTANLVTVRLSGGAIDIYNSAGFTHVIADVVGYYGAGGSVFVPVPNTRVLDSRVGSGIRPLGTWGSRQEQTLRLTGRATIPATATAVALNVTGVGQTEGTYLTVSPAANTGFGGTSNVNLVGGGPPRPNAVTVGLGAGGAVDIYNYAGRIDVVVDVVGYFVPE
ncbi:MAG: hypothetical protein QNM02_04645 [Acidimicrobiia bacterium]|nr:hypothetical protein [Acidimicrobiia bacterium]